MDYITGAEFTRWMNHLDQQNRQIIAEQRKSLLEQQKTNGRVTALESNQKDAGKLSAKMSVLVSAIAAGIIQGTLAVLGGK
jgi:hypothetical protein